MSEESMVIVTLKPLGTLPEPAYVVTARPATLVPPVNLTSSCPSSVAPPVIDIATPAARSTPFEFITI